MTATTSIPAPDICDDPLAINFQEVGDCEYRGFDPEDNTTNENDCGCGGSNGSGTTGYLGMSKKTWMWIIIAAIAGYYFYKNRN